MAISLIGLGVKQGSVIKCGSFSEELLGIISDSRANISSRSNAITSDYILVVISQDCDISSPEIGSIEALALKIAKSKYKKNVRYRNGRTFERLVLPIDETSWFAQSDWISSIDKKLLLREEVDLIIEGLSDRNTGIILRWLTDKLLRRPLPHGFNTRFLPHIRTDDFSQFLEDHHNSILEVYVYVSPEVEDADLYDVIVVALLEIDCDSGKEELIRQKFKELCEELSDKPELNMLQPKGEAGRILDAVDYVVLPEDFSKADEMKMKPLSLNYLCWPDN